MNRNTIIFTIRNREADRIFSLVNSIRKNAITSPIILVDYGSYEAFSEQYKKACYDLNVSYVKSETEGLPWSRAIALNIGIKAADTQFVTTTDVDMIFVNNPYEYIYNITNLDNKIIHMESYWLPQSGEFDEATSAGTGSRGGFAFFAKKNIEKIGGYDERLLFWGFEDVDFSSRFNAVHCSIEWLPSNKFKIYHKWHPVAESGNLRPTSAEFDSRRFYYENMATPILKQNWGLPLTKKDRPILDKMQNSTPSEFNVPHGEMSNRLPDLLEKAETEKFIKLDLGPRFKEKPLKKFQKPIKTFLQKTFLRGTGLVCVPELNNNFDVFYPVLEKFTALGLKDYYITSDCRFIYLLWR